MGLAAFAVAILAGLNAGNPADAILGRAVASLAIGWAGGLAVGMVLEHLVRLEKRKIDTTSEAALSALAAEAEALMRGSDDSMEQSAVETENRSSAVSGGAVSTGFAREKTPG